MEFKKFCCFCLTKHNKLVDVQTYDVDNISFCAKIAEIMPKTLQYKFEGHPTMICGKCKKKLSNFYTFVQDALKVHEILKKPYSVLWSDSKSEQNVKTEIQYEQLLQEKIDTNNEAAVSNLSCLDISEVIKKNDDLDSNKDDSIVEASVIIKEEPPSDLLDESSVVDENMDDSDATQTEPLNNPADEEENIDSNFYDNIENQECDPFEIYELKPCIETLQIDQANYEETYISSTKDDMNVNNAFSSSDPLDYKSENSLTPPEVVELAKEATHDLLPKRSRERYEQAYVKFVNWSKIKKIKRYSENALLAYFQQLPKKKSLWSTYSMLKCCLIIHNNINIATYSNLIAYLKRQRLDHKPKQSQTFEENHINIFINEAPDKTYLLMKVVLIMGISGACRREELCKMLVDNLEFKANVITVTIPDLKTNVSRSFAIIQTNWINLIKKYVDIRAKIATKDRLFYTYRNGECVNIPLGLNAIGKIPSGVAKYLNLDKPNEFTGHCFRRTSAKILSSNGGGLISVKRFAGRESSTVTEESLQNRLSIVKNLTEASTSRE